VFAAGRDQTMFAAGRDQTMFAAGRDQTIYNRRRIPARSAPGATLLRSAATGGYLPSG